MSSIALSIKFRHFPFLFYFFNPISSGHIAKLKKQNLYFAQNSLILAFYFINRDYAHFTLDPHYCNLLLIIFKIYIVIHNFFLTINGHSYYCSSNLFK